MQPDDYFAMREVKQIGMEGFLARRAGLHVRQLTNEEATVAIAAGFGRQKRYEMLRDFRADNHCPVCGAAIGKDARTCRKCYRPDGRGLRSGNANSKWAFGWGDK